MSLEKKQDIAFSGPLFIVGMPRSGTKLMRDLLNNHQQIAIPDIETRLLPTWSKNWLAYGDLSQPLAFKGFYQEMIHLSYFRYMKEDDRLIAEQSWYKLCRNFSIAGVFEALIRHDTKTAGEASVIWGDKSPLYFRHVPLLRELFPEAKFIHIVRDVRDYCLSIKKAWGKNMLRAAQRWCDDIENFQRESKHLGNNYLEIKYENLLASPESTLNTICIFLGLDFQKEMLSLCKPSENLGDAKGLKRIKHDNKNKYLSLMTPAMRRNIEMISAHILRSYDYKTDYSGRLRRVSRVRLLFYKLLDMLNLLIFDIRQHNVINAIKRGFYSYKLIR